MAEINPGDFVNVSFTVGGSTLANYQVLKLPSNIQNYWEFQGPKGDVVAAALPIVTRPPP